MTINTATVHGGYSYILIFLWSYSILTCLFRSLRLLRQPIRFAFSDLGYLELKVSLVEHFGICIQKEFLGVLPTAVEGKSPLALLLRS